MYDYQYINILIILVMSYYPLLLPDPLALTFKQTYRVYGRPGSCAVLLRDIMGVQMYSQVRQTGAGCDGQKCSCTTTTGDTAFLTKNSHSCIVVVLDRVVVVKAAYWLPG